MADVMTDEVVSAAAPDRAAIRSGIETARAATRQLVESIPEGAWRRKSGNSAWTCGQLASHLSLNDGLIRIVEGARKGKNFSPPMFVVNIVNVFMTRRAARKQTRDSLLAGFDAGTERWLAMFDATTNAQLSTSVKVFGDQVTVAGLYGWVSSHLAEHGPDIRAGIGAAT